ncbi:hypothetical protein C8R45DRAFT_384283 [Mycena sanguinolenta]|nr:hypothetical protein C8R45DRAFT_384283 [Mycena sanguinolenta]
MYSARVVGRKKPMTVAVYQGGNAEEQWQRALSGHSVLRHPHILQIYTSASSSGIHAMIFHDDLVPIEQFLGSYRYSAISRAYILAYTHANWHDAYEYYTRIMAKQELLSRSWIRRSTGRLCIQIDPLATYDGLPPGPAEQLPPERVLGLHYANQESLILASLGYPEWYSLCDSYLDQRQSSAISVRAEVNVGSIIRWLSYSRFERAIEAASATDTQIKCSGWYRLTFSPWREDSYTRCQSRDVFGSTLGLGKGICTAASWLAQANYIFKRLQIVSNHEDYKFVDWVRFSLEIPEAMDNPPEGYLFVCSPKDFESGPTSFRWPERPVYWSLDPSGNNRLSDEEASRLGFPAITRRTDVFSSYWDETVYAGLCKFDECKGFDPQSQDLARTLGYPLYEVSVPTSAMELDSALDEDDRSDYSSSYSEEEYTIEDAMKSDSLLTSSYLEECTPLDSELSWGSESSHVEPSMEDGVDGITFGFGKFVY